MAWRWTGGRDRTLWKHDWERPGFKVLDLLSPHHHLVPFLVAEVLFVQEERCGVHTVEHLGVMGWDVRGRGSFGLDFMGWWRGKKGHEEERKEEYGVEGTLQVFIETHYPWDLIRVWVNMAHLYCNFVKEISRWVQRFRAVNSNLAVCCYFQKGFCGLNLTLKREDVNVHTYSLRLSQCDWEFIKD